MKKNYMKKFKYISFLLLFSLISYSQQNVSGLIIDSQKIPLSGVNILVKGTQNGTMSDFDGNFQIAVNSGQTLVFSYIGYETQELVVTETFLNVVMKEESSELEEVVLIGYGSVRKKDLTGAVDLVTEKNFNKGSVVSPQQLIQGKVAGVSIVSNSGAPGEGSNVLIRGIGSLNLNSNPLFVVDGLPLDSGGVGGTRNPLNVINPNDIESMSVLKDASATAIYGSRAANGVVLITTKKGKKGALKFNFSSRVSSFDPINKIDVLSADEFRSVIQSTADSDFISRLGDSTTDWQDEIYDTAYAINNSLSLSGGIGEMPFRISMAQTDQDGILKGDNFSRTSASLNISPEFFEGKLKVNVSTRYVETNNDFANRGAIGSAANFDPTKPVFNFESVNPFQPAPFLGYYTWLTDQGNKLALSPTNPVALLNLTEDKSTVNRFIGNFKMDYSILSDLVASINVGYDKSKGVGLSFTDKNLPTDAVGFNGNSSDYINESTNKSFDTYLNYSKLFSDTSLSLTVGHSYQSFEYNNESANQVEYLNTDGTINTETSLSQSFIDKSRNILLSYFGRLNINFNDKYLITSTFRSDASSKLPSDDRWGNFFSAAFAWNIHNENFGVDKLFQELKIRVGVGEVGNVNGLGDYNFLTRYVRSDSRSFYGFGGDLSTTFRPAPINKDLRWEVGQTYNAGIDFRFSKIKLNGSFNAYIRNTNDLIATAIVDPFTNFGTSLSANIGDMVNKGLEFELNSTLIDKDEFQLSLNYNLSLNNNEITRLENEQNVGGLGLGNNLQRHEQGKAPYSFYVFKQIYDELGKPIEGAYADLNGDGQINQEDRYFYKDPYADVLMGLSIFMNYKNFDVSMASRASLGNYSYNQFSAASNLTQITNLNRLSNVHIDYLNSGFINFSDKNIVSDHYIQNASFFRLDNLTLGYTINNFIKENPIRLYLTSDNVFVISNYNGIDPEITGGIDSSFYPRARSVAFGFDFKF